MRLNFIMKQSNIHSKQLPDWTPEMGVFQLTKVIIFFRIYNLQPWVFSESVSSKIRIDEIDFGVDRSRSKRYRAADAFCCGNCTTSSHRMFAFSSRWCNHNFALTGVPASPYSFSFRSPFRCLSLSFLASSCYAITTWSLFYLHEIRLVGVSPSRFS